MTETLPQTAEATDEATRLHYVAIDQSYDAQQAAKDAAQERLTNELNEGGVMRRMLKSIWKGGAFKEYYEQKYTREALHEIEDSGNVLHFQADEQGSQRAKLATVDRYLFESDELLHAEAGERRETIDDDNELSQEIKELIRRNVEGDLSDEAMLEERTRLLSAYQEANGSDMAKRGLVRVDNLIEVANAVKGAVEHGESLDAVMQNMRISLGESRSGVRTEAHYSRYERIADKLAQTKVGSLVTPETLITAVTLAGSIARLGGRSAVGAATKTIAPGIAGGLWAALRENKRMKQDRQQHARERAQGKEYEAGSKRRDEMETTMYESQSASELTEILNRHFGEDATFDSQEAVQAAIAALANTELAVRTSDSKGVDLITYSAADAVEEERLALDLARANAKVVAQTQLEDPTVRQYLGISDEATVRDVLNEQIDTLTSAMETDMSDKDRLFNKIKRRNVAKAAAIGTVAGLVAGTVAQEGMAALSDTRVGLVEQLWDAHNTAYHGTMHQTLLESLVHGNHDVSSHVTHVAPSSTYDSFNLGEHGKIELSSDMSMQTHDGLITIKDHNGNILADHLTTNDKGDLTHESLARLREAHINVSNTSHNVELPSTVEEKHVGLHEYLAAHHGDTTHVTREFWYDNNTARFDKNELRLDWGDQGDGITNHGSYQFSIAGMQPDGSSHDAHSVAWQEAARNGNLKLAISASANSQNHVFMVDVRPDGTVNIPKGSPAAEFFSNHDGQAVFNGKYAEIVQTAGKGHDGAVHIRPLATLVGTDEARSGHYAVTHEVSHVAHRPEYKLTSGGYDKRVETPGTFTEMAPVIPIVPRRPLERLKERTPEAPSYYGYGRELDSGIYRDHLSPRLLEDANATLNPREEYDWYRDRVSRDTGPEYVREIDEAIDQSPELRSVTDQIQDIVTIPIKASGEAESEHIYELMKTYAGQADGAAAKTLMLLHVNWFDTAMANPEERARIERTKAEIQRARTDFPELKIATIESEWNDADRKGGVIGRVAQKMNDAALFAMQRAMREGRMSDEHDVLIVRNDADPKGMSKRYLANYLKAFAENSGTDVYTGTTRFDNRKAKDLPGLVFAANFMQSLNLISSAKENSTHTGGANFGVRGSTFAAVADVIRANKENDTGAGSDDVAIGRAIKGARSGRYTYLAHAQVGKLTPRPRRSAYGYADADKSPANTKRRVGMRVFGAQIDTDSDRQEAVYLQGAPIVLSWEREYGFDAGGHKDRSADLSSPEMARLREQAVHEPLDKVIQRIQKDMEGSINATHESQATIDAALGMTFFGLKSGSAHGYVLDRVGKQYRLRFTPEGVNYLKNRLTRDSHGRFESYGTRLSRQLYGRTAPQAKRQKSNPPLQSVV